MGTVCKILNRQELKPHKVRYYLERRDAEFEAKMAEVLCVYREAALLKEQAAATAREPRHLLNGLGIIRTATTFSLIVA